MQKGIAVYIQNTNELKNVSTLHTTNDAINAYISP